MARLTLENDGSLIVKMDIDEKDEIAEGLTVFVEEMLTEIDRVRFVTDAGNEEGYQPDVQIAALENLRAYVVDRLHHYVAVKNHPANTDDNYGR